MAIDDMGREMYIDGLREEIEQLEAEKAELLAACQKVLSILDLQPEPKLGGWNWPVIADEIRALLDKHAKP